MNLRYWLTGLLILGINVSLAAQDFLKYFNGNKDSLKAASVAMIDLPAPVFSAGKPQKMSKEALADLGFEQVYKSMPRRFVMRDGKKIFAQKFMAQSSYTIVLLHGVGATSYIYNKTAGLLRKTSGAEVYAIDLRGHGQSEGKKGDLSYINQYAHDVADIVTTIRKEKPKGKVIIAGHSMGGGIALRLASLKDAPLVDGFLLFAPLLGNNSPTLPRPKRESHKEIAEPFMKIHMKRWIGIRMLNSIGNHHHDHKPVLFLNLPKTAPLRQYSYRANASMAPDDYVQGLKAVKTPLLVLVGGKDEAFVATAFEPAVRLHTKGKTVVVPKATHNGIRHSPEAMKEIKQWFDKL